MFRMQPAELRHVYYLPDLPRDVLRGPGCYQRGMLGNPVRIDPPHVVREPIGDGWQRVLDHVARLIAAPQPAGAM